MSRKTDEFPEVIVYPAIWKTLSNVLGSLMFVGAGYVFAINPDTNARLIGIAAIIVFAITGVYATWRLIVRTPVIVVNRDGMFDNASMFAVGWIEWSEIERIEPKRTYLVRLICIVPHNRETIFARVPPLRRLAIRIKAAFANAPVNIPGAFLGRQLDQVEALIDRYFTEFGN